MQNSLPILIKERNQEAIIQVITDDPSTLEKIGEGSASMFVTLAYHGLQEAFEVAKRMKKDFSFHEAIIAGRLEDVISGTSETSIVTLSDDGFTPISLAAYFNDFIIAKHLLYHGADPDTCAENPSQVNALHAAVARENYELVKLLLNHNADVNATQTQDVTALHSAVKRGNYDLTKLLITYGADLNATMTNGDTALSIAKNEKHDEILELIDSAQKYPTLKVIDKIAWIEIKDKELLSTRSKGKTAYYIPGGKRDPGETDHETLIREIKEELCVDINITSIKYLGTYKAQADGHKDGIIVKMTCYSADYSGELHAANEIEKLRWLTYGDYDKISHVDRVIFDHLRYLGVM